MAALQAFETNGVTLHYTKSGQGQPLVFIPGSISDYRTWANIRQSFENDFSCYVLSRRFQHPGQYPAGADSSVAANTADLAAFLTAQGVAPAILVGHSFGGFIALNLAMQYPELVKSVVAEEPIFAPALASNPKNPIQLLALMLRHFRAGKSFARLGMKGIDPTFKALSEGDTVAAQKHFINGVTEGRQTPETLDPLTRVQLADNIAALAGEDPFNNRIRLADLHRVQCPVLLLSGTDSPFVFRYINETLLRRLGNVQHQIFPNSSHWLHIDQPEAYVQSVKAFIGQ